MIPAIPHILSLQTICISRKIRSSLLWLQRWSAPIPHCRLPPRLSPSGVHVLSWYCWRHDLLIQIRWCCQGGLDRSWYGDLLGRGKRRSQWWWLRRHHCGNWLGSWDWHRSWWWCSHLLHHLQLHLHTHERLVQLRWWCRSWWNPRHHNWQKSLLSTWIHIWRHQHLRSWEQSRYMLLVHTGQGHDRHVWKQAALPPGEMSHPWWPGNGGSRPKEVCRCKLLSCGIPSHSVLNPHNQWENAGSRLLGWGRCGN